MPGARTLSSFDTPHRYARPMADVAPFRAIRYAHPTAEVTSPPYDVLTPELRDRYRARDPHNVVHLTLGDSEEEAGRLFRTWLEEGVLVRDLEARRLGGRAGLRRA